MADHEEHILYLMIELDEALARKTPQWAPEQMDVARRSRASVLERLLAIVPRGAAVTPTLQPNKSPQRAVRPKGAAPH